IEIRCLMRGAASKISNYRRPLDWEEKSLAMRSECSEQSARSLNANGAEGNEFDKNRSHAQFLLPIITRPCLQSARSRQRQEEAEWFSVFPLWLREVRRRSPFRVLYR